MTLVSVLPLDFTGTRKCEPLLGTGIRLHFWHYSYKLSVNNLFLFNQFGSHEHGHALSFELGELLHFPNLFKVLGKS